MPKHIPRRSIIPSDFPMDPYGPYDPNPTNYCHCHEGSERHARKGGMIPNRSDKIYYVVLGGVALTAIILALLALQSKK